MLETYNEAVSIPSDLAFPSPMRAIVVTPEEETELLLRVSKGARKSSVFTLFQGLRSEVGARSQDESSCPAKASTFWGPSGFFAECSDILDASLEVDTLVIPEGGDVLHISCADGGRGRAHVAAWSDTGFTTEPPCRESFEAKLLEVPFRSQFWEDPSFAKRICLPTSLAMVLEYYGISISTERVARGIYDENWGIYGNWLRACLFASQKGLSAKVMASLEPRDLYFYISKGVPLILSVAYEAGDLVNAPIKSTQGHLLVLCGFETSCSVLCQDPALKDGGEAPVSYDLRELTRAWKGNLIVVERLGLLQ